MQLLSKIPRPLIKKLQPTNRPHKLPYPKAKMTSAQTQPNYNYTRPSTAATRSLVSSDAAATGEASPYGTLHRRKTNNYESAVADQLNTTVNQASTSATSKPDLDAGGAQSATKGH